VLFTLTRLASTERYKGYNKVMEALVQIEDPRVKYLIAGKYDAIEKKFIDDLILKLGLQDRVILAGFIPEEEVASHFRLSDVYVMPSMKEGFGIVFIEAMYYQLPVIAGNKDGSVDALLNGELGILVDPQDVEAIKDALESVLLAPKAYLPNQEVLAQHFSYEAYKYNVNRLLARHGGWAMPI
jgi:glycosyltransferase involved in cell wall biosynthesis